MHDTPVDKNLDAFKTMFTSHLDKLENSLTKMQKHLEERDSEITVLKEKYDALLKIARLRPAAIAINNFIRLSDIHKLYS